MKPAHYVDGLRGEADEFIPYPFAYSSGFERFPAAKPTNIEYFFTGRRVRIIAEISEVSHGL